MHLRQNAFGLFIARHPYHWEFVLNEGPCVEGMEAIPCIQEQEHLLHG